MIVLPLSLTFHVLSKFLLRIYLFYFSSYSSFFMNTFSSSYFYVIFLRSAIVFNIYFTLLLEIVSIEKEDLYIFLKTSFFNILSTFFILSLHFFVVSKTLSANHFSHFLSCEKCLLCLSFSCLRFILFLVMPFLFVPFLYPLSPFLSHSSLGALSLILYFYFFVPFSLRVLQRDLRADCRGFVGGSEQ